MLTKSGISGQLHPDDSAVLVPRECGTCVRCRHRGNGHGGLDAESRGQHLRRQFRANDCERRRRGRHGAPKHRAVCIFCWPSVRISRAHLARRRRARVRHPVGTVSKRTALFAGGCIRRVMAESAVRERVLYWTRWNLRPRPQPAAGASHAVDWALCDGESLLVPSVDSLMRCSATLLACSDWRSKLRMAASMDRDCGKRDNFVDQICSGRRSLANPKSRTGYPRTAVSYPTGDQTVN